MSTSMSSSLTELCARCQDIDFAQIIRTKPYEYIGRCVMQLDASFEQLIASRCPLCRLFGSMKPTDHPGESTDSYPCQLRAFSALGVVIGQTVTQSSNNDDTVILGVVDNVSLAPWPENGSHIWHCVHQAGFLCPLNTAMPEPMFTVRRMHRDQFNVGLANTWLSRCRLKHGAECLIPDSSARELRVIDCRSKRVVEAPPQCQYVALSYVWSQSCQSDSTAATSKDGHMLQDLPKVVEDSIELVLLLGLEHLWID